MNKLIIVGNGFDLAHGLPTSYGNFMNDFWKNLKFNFETDKVKDIFTLNPNYFRFLEDPCENYGEFIKNLIYYIEAYGYRYEVNNIECYTDNSRTTCIFRFKNEFFKEINNKSYIENWVDIETKPLWIENP